MDLVQSDSDASNDATKIKDNSMPVQAKAKVLLDLESIPTGSASDFTSPQLQKGNRMAKNPFMNVKIVLDEILSVNLLEDQNVVEPMSPIVFAEDSSPINFKMANKNQT